MTLSRTSFHWSLFPVLQGTSSEPTCWVMWGLVSSPRSPQTASLLGGRAQLCAQVCGWLWPGGRHAGPSRHVCSTECAASALVPEPLTDRISGVRRTVPWYWVATTPRGALQTP